MSTLSLPKESNEQALLRAFSSGATYISASRLAKATGISVEEVTKFAIAYPNKIRKSIMRTSNGEELFCLNTEFGWLYDIWNAFCCLNAKKY